MSWFISRTSSAFNSDAGHVHRIELHGESMRRRGTSGQLSDSHDVPKEVTTKG